MLRDHRPHAACDDPELDELIERFVGEQGSTIPILQAVQERRGYLSEDDIVRVSASTGIPVSRLLGVATFYAQFRLAPAGRHVIRVCSGTACHVAGTELVTQALEDELDVTDGETTKDGMFTLETVACLGCCSLAPAMVIDEDVQARMTPEAARRLVRRIKQAETKEEAGAARAGKGTRGEA
jgi:NADH-quinone oxidoreductase subunit E